VKTLPILEFASCLLLVGAAVFFCDDYGSNWDEMVHSRYGNLVVEYFRSGLKDTACNEWVNMRFYGPLFEVIPSAIRPEGGDLYAIRHLWLALLGVGVVAGAWCFARRLGPICALVSALALVAMPRFVGHAFHNSKDIPFALTIAWFIVAWSRIVVTRDQRWRSYLLLGTAAGFVLCARPGGLPIVLAYMFGGLVLSDLTRDRAVPEPRLLPRLGVAFCVAWVLMVLPWPWAHENPLMNPIRAMGIAAAFDNVYPVLFDGTLTKSDALPRIYLPWYLSHATPLPVLALAFVGLIAMVREQFTDFRGVRSRMFGLLELWIFAPIAMLVIVRPNIYDGLRHVLFVLPALAIMAGIGAVSVVRASGRRARVPVASVVLVLLAMPFRNHVQLHPYQSTYFNELAGGVGEAAAGYETDYWATSFREAMEWLDAHGGDRPMTFGVRGSWLVARAASYYAPPRFAALRGLKEDPTTWPAEVDAVISTTRAACLYGEGLSGWKVVHEVGRDGAVFAQVLRRVE